MEHQRLPATAATPSATTAAVPTPGGPPPGEGGNPGGAYAAAPPQPVAADIEFGETVKYLPNGEASRHRVYCGGLVVIGPQPGRLALTLGILLVPFVAMAIFVFPYTATGLLAAGVTAFALCILSLLRLATKDPGLVPQRVDPPKYPPPNMDRVQIVRTVKGADGEAGSCCIGGGAIVETRRALQQDTDNNAGGGSNLGDPASPYTQSVSDEEIRLKEEAMIKFCSTCKRYRGPRTFHCGECNRCVDMYDHHCPWVGTCVGAHNYHLFLWFLFTLQSALFLSLAVVVHTPLAVSADDGISMVDAMTKLRWMPVLIFLYVLCLGMPATVLTLFHCFLVSKGRLTIEHLRRVYEGQNKVNPYDEGCCANWGRLCGAYHPVALADSFIDVFVKSVEHIDYKLRQRKAEQSREPMGRSVDAAASRVEEEMRYEQEHQARVANPTAATATTPSSAPSTTPLPRGHSTGALVPMSTPETPAERVVLQVVGGSGMSIMDSPSGSPNGLRPGAARHHDYTPSGRGTAASPDRFGTPPRDRSADAAPGAAAAAGCRELGEAGNHRQPPLCEQSHCNDDDDDDDQDDDDEEGRAGSRAYEYSSPEGAGGAGIGPDDVGSPLVVTSPGAAMRGSASTTASPDPLAATTKLQARRSTGTPGASELAPVILDEPESITAVAYQQQQQPPQQQEQQARSSTSPALLPGVVRSGSFHADAASNNARSNGSGAALRPLAPPRDGMSPEYSDIGLPVVRTRSGVIPSSVIRRSLERLPGAVSPSLTPRGSAGQAHSGSTE